MRKNFTQLFMGVALLVGFVTAGHSQCEIDPPPGAYYNFQFDGGPEGWRTLDAAGFETMFGWAYSATADISMGAYGPEEGTVMTSESQCNGAMIMDSDFLDNRGVPNDFGLGDCPAPCNSYLQSPVLDFSGITTEVDLMFFQAVRQFQSEFYIYTSIDGGATNRDTITINEDYILNADYREEMVRLPLCGLTGEANVVVTFHYVGDYYFWGIDDVSFVEAAESVDVRVNSNFYTKVANYATPFNMGTTVPILADIENVRAYESPAPVLNYRVRDELGQEIFSSSRSYDPVPGCSTDENKLFVDQFTMPGEVGNYSVEFEIEAEGDVNQDNDVLTSPFKMTEREFRKLPTAEEHGSDYISGFRYGDGLISWGSYFEFPQNDGLQAIESITLGYSTSTQDSIPSPGFINIAVYQWVDFDNFGTVDPGERLLLGEVDQIIAPNAPPEARFTVTPLDPNGELIVPDPGAEILVVAHTNPFDEMTNYFFLGVDEESFPEYSYSATQFAHEEAGLIGGYGSFAAANSASHDDRHDRSLFNVDAGGVIWDISMILTPPVSTEEINETLSIGAFPSPANEVLTIEINLDEVSEKVSVELMDMAGNRAIVKNFSNVKRDNLTINVSELPSGMYLMNVRTEAGLKTQKVSIMH